MNTLKKLYEKYFDYALIIALVILSYLNNVDPDVTVKDYIFISMLSTIAITISMIKIVLNKAVNKLEQKI